MKGGRIALLDFGQSKQLPPWQVAAFASLIVALASGDKPRVSASLDDLGLEIGTADVAIRYARLVEKGKGLRGYRSCSTFRVHATCYSSMLR